MNRSIRKIRLALFGQGSVKKYVLYSLGEITLVVIGILIAIQVDNWNEARKQETQFKADIEQIYNILDRDIDVLNYGIHGFSKQVAIVDSILAGHHLVDFKLIPILLAYVDVTPARFHSEISYQLDHLTYNRQEPAQRALTKSISEYANTLEQSEIVATQYVTPLFQEHKLSIPTLVFGISDLNNFSAVDRDFFSEKETNKIISLLHDDQFRNALKSLKSMKQANGQNLFEIMLSAKAKQRAIKQYFPDIRLLYTNIGLVGSGTEKRNWDDDIELVSTDSMRSKWEGDLVLTDGEIKFRNEKNWITNWGGTGFPRGNILFNGENIKTVAGAYHVVFDLNEKTYEFIKKVD